MATHFVSFRREIHSLLKSNFEDPNHNRSDSLRRQSFIQQPQFDHDPAYALLTSAGISGDLTATNRLSSPIPSAPLLKHQLPLYLKPLPPRMTSVDIDYLFAKGALSLPETSVRNALLRAYIEYVHPYMPLVELHELLGMINDASGKSGKVSLLLFQAIMFAGTAFVDMEFLRKAGYTNRKAARKAFFQKARVLHDFDYEVDRVCLVQALLLMTYWYETPDDQKDTWHWMGIAISLAHTIGLHRNPANSSMSPSKKKLWKRMWWSCFMRDRLVALGMRRPTRIKEEDYDVPMLTEDDFEIQALDEHNSVIGKECELIRDVRMQRELAQMCIAKAKLCLCISHVLSAQYSVLVKHQGMQGQEGSTRSSVMLFPKKLDQTDEVQSCDVELSDWISSLPQACMYNNTTASGPVFVQRALLHMVYHTTVSALHRPQVLPSAATNPTPPATLHDISRLKVREASRQITLISTDLHTRNLERFLPTTGVTVLLPAIIIHLLDIKSASEEERKAAMEGFKRCMIVLEGLRGNYSSADFATQFLEAAVRKAGIEVGGFGGRQKEQGLVVHTGGRGRANTPPMSEGIGEEDEGSAYMHERGHMGDALGDQHPLSHITVKTTVHTPPENDHKLDLNTNPTITHSHDLDLSSNNNSNNNTTNNTFLHPNNLPMSSIETFNDPPPIDYSSLNLSDFLNFDGAGGGSDLWNVPLEEGAHGESGGFMGDMGLGWDGLPAGSGWSRVGSPVPEFGLEVTV